jgi:pyruvate/2-oxoglutarate dehydrogenase complex dihydrolipoamide dehydrogenase (E3) component
VDEHLQTTNSSVYACGDVCSQYKFTHMADAMARMVVRNALFLGRAKVSDLIIPWSTYTFPEIAHVGPFERDLEAQGVKTSTFKMDFSSNDRAILDDDTEGFVKVWVKEGTDQVLAATVVNPKAGDLISELTVVIQNKIGLSTLATVIHPYPTQADAIRRLGDMFNKTRLTTFAKIFLRKLAQR